MAKHRVNWHLDMGKKQFHEGDIVVLTPEQSGELCKLGVVTPMDAAQAADVSGVEIIAPKELAKLSKDNLAEYAKALFGADLDASAMTKDALLAEIATLAAESEK